MAHYRKQMITIFLTNSCNLNCVYCYIDGSKTEEKRVIDVNFALKGIRDYFDQTGNYAVRFFSDGEPTLAFEQMKLIKKHLLELENKLNMKVKYEIQTNGVFSEEIAEWISQNIDVVYISIDGTPQINDQLRRSMSETTVSDIVERNIRIIAANSSVQLGVRSTICSLNVDKQIDIIKYFKHLGVNIIFADQIFSKVGGGTSYLGINYIDFIDKFVEAKKYASSIGVFYSTMYESNFDENTIYGCRSCLPTPHLTVDGYVSCCDMCVSGDSPMQELIYGIYDSEAGEIIYDEKSIKRIQLRNKFEIPSCKYCEVRDHCGGACLGEALNETGQFFGTKDESCNAIKYLWKKLGEKESYLPYLHP